MKMKKAFTIIICALCCITLLATATPVKAEALSLTSITYRLRSVLNNWTNQLKDRFESIFSGPEQTPDYDTDDRDDGNVDYDDNHQNDESEDSNTQENHHNHIFDWIFDKGNYKPGGNSGGNSNTGDNTGGNSNIGGNTGANTGNGSATASSNAQQMLNMINEERQANGLASLQWNADLAEVAQAKAQDMLDNNYFSHTSPTYGSAFEMMRDYGISYRYAAENIAKNSSVEKAHVALMNSEGHRNNILNSNLTSIGIGIVKSSAGYIIVQMFIG